MDILRKIWPTPFKIKNGDVTSFVVQLIIFVVVCFVAGVLIGVLKSLPIIGFAFGIVGSLLGAYSTVGIVLCILKFLNVVK